jgi:hypothetical protein
MHASKSFFNEQHPHPVDDEGDEQAPGVLRDRHARLMRIQDSR